MIKITITAYVDEKFLNMETSDNIPTKEAVHNLLERQFPCLEEIEINQEKQ